MGAATVLQFSTALEENTCWSCGVLFALPGNMLRHRRENGGSVFCPSGHENWWNESECDKLKKRLKARDEALERREQAHERTRERLQSEERSHSATKGHLTRTKKRVSGGVCPCCNRSFVALARHMKTKHPNYVTTEESG